MHLYSGTSEQFVRAATLNQIADRLTEAWVAYHRYAPSTSEQRSWKNSLSKMADTVRLAGLDDHGVICEYQLPLTSRRLDVMITGSNQDGRPTASIVELKQWDDVRPSAVDECVLTWIGGGWRQTLHPSVQVGQYQRYLQDVHESFTQGDIALRASAYLHNLTYDAESELFAPKHLSALNVNPVFAGDRVEELAEWLVDHLSGGNGVPDLNSVVNGRYRPSKGLMAHVAKVTKGEPTYVLLDEQKVVFNEVLARVQAAHADPNTSEVVLVKGGPGTGKSVVAVNLVAELSEHGYVTHHATGSKAFTINLRKRVGSRRLSKKLLK